MNDDFIKRHKQRPDPRFVERLYQKINIPPQRSFSMFNRRIRPALMITLALAITAILTFTFSPTVRAAVQSLLTFNGVTVTFDEETGKLVVSGNTDAVIEQTDHSVLIQGENGDMAGAGVAVAVAVPGEEVNVNDLFSRNPDLSLPIAPAGYNLQPLGQSNEDGSLLFTWQNTNGYMITYQRSLSSDQGPGLGGIVSSGELVVPPDGSPASLTVSGGAEVSSGSTQIGGAGDLVPLAIYSWQSDGYFHTLFASDPSLSEADLKAMLP
jgi:hypothetical protein